MNGVSMEDLQFAFLSRSGFDIQIKKITTTTTDYTPEVRINEKEQKKNTEICKDCDTMSETLESLA